MYVEYHQRCRHLRRPELFRLSARQVSCNNHSRYRPTSIFTAFTPVQRAAQIILAIGGFDALLGFSEACEDCSRLFSDLSLASDEM